MSTDFHKPVLIVIAGPNGSGKTSVTEQILRHEWMENATYINPDIVAEEKFGGWSVATHIADRCYIYDNSAENHDAKLLFRIMDGKLKKLYSKEIPEWAKFIYDAIEK